MLSNYSWVEPSAFCKRIEFGKWFPELVLLVLYDPVGLGMDGLVSETGLPTTACCA